MSRKCCRFFGGLLNTQADWLNRMSDQGWRLVRTEKLLYEFEACAPGQVRYCVEFIGEKSKERAEDYRNFLEDMGYRVFWKPINLNWSVGKVHWRPWAEKGGRISTSSTTFIRELLIVEKENDGTPFELHTTCEDLARYYITAQSPWLFLALLFAAAAFLCRLAVFGIPAVLLLLPAIMYEAQILELRREAITYEGGVNMKETGSRTGKSRLILTILTVAVLLVLALTRGFPGINFRRSAVRIGFVESADRDSWTARYISLNGWMERDLYPESGKIQVDVTTESGTLSLEMKDADGNIIFSEEDIGTGSREVDVTGKTVVRVTGDSHSGSFTVESEPQG